MTRVGAVWRRDASRKQKGIWAGRNAYYVRFPFLPGWSMKVQERQVTIHFEKLEVGGFLAAKDVSPCDFRVRLIFISPKHYNCRP
jgi:hypothetical protein